MPKLVFQYPATQQTNNICLKDDNGICCGDPLQDNCSYNLDFELTASIGGIPVFDFVETISVDGTVLVFDYAIDLKLDYYKRILIERFKALLDDLGYVGDAIRYEVFDNGLHRISAFNSDAVFDFVNDGVSSYNFVQDCPRPDPSLFLYDSLGYPSKTVVEGATPPQNTIYLWRNHTDGLLYWYDGEHWVTVDTDSFEFRTFPVIGNTNYFRYQDRSINGNKGPISPYNSKIVKISIRSNAGNESGTIRFDSDGANVGEIPIDLNAGNVFQSDVGVPVLIDKGSNISPRWFTGTNGNDVILTVYFAKVCVL